MTRIIAILVLVSTIGLAPDRASAVQDQAEHDRAGSAPPLKPADTSPPRSRADDRRRGEPAHRRFGPPWRPTERSDTPREFGRWDRTGPRDFTLDDARRKLIIEVVNDLRPLSEQDRDRLLDMPEENLRKLLTGDASRIFYLSRLRQLDPDLYELKIRDLRLSQELVRLARQYRHLHDAGSEEADLIHVEMREKVVEQYNIRLATREHEIAQLERRVESMRARIAEERTQREGVIDQWMAELDAPLETKPTSDSAEGDKKTPTRSGSGD